MMKAVACLRPLTPSASGVYSNGGRQKPLHDELQTVMWRRSQRHVECTVLLQRKCDPNASCRSDSIKDPESGHLNCAKASPQAARDPSTLPIIASHSTRRRHSRLRSAA